MISKAVRRAGALIASLLAGFAAEAAVLDAIHGGVLISRDGGPYRIVSQPTQLKPGDSIVANPGSGADVIFYEGCIVPIHPGMVYMVPATPPCEAGVPPAEVAGVGDYTMVAVGAAIVAGGVGIAIAAGGGGGGGGGSPASP